MSAGRDDGTRPDGLLEPGAPGRRAAEELDARARRILRAVVRGYAETGEPVASLTLARQPGIDLSAASVRAVLADLEALGYLDKPHTSAGRIPTEKGYRLYVDALVRLQPVGARERDVIDARYDPARGVEPADDLLARTPALLHALTRLAGVASPPDADEPVRTVEFVRLREDRVLAVCVTRGGAVRNRLLQIDFAIDQPELDRASRYLAERLREGEGGTLGALREALLAELATERARADEAARRALELGARALEPEPDRPGLVLEGGASLVQEPTLADVEQVRRTMRALEEKQRIASLLARAAEAGELMLFIGRETGIEGADALAVVASPYGGAGTVLGAIGVIGPARMAYGRVIPIVEYTARALLRVLGE